jgi:glutamine---fructose-6-phosphate transaminase (isomerizing)
MTDYTFTEIQSQPEVWQQTLELCEQQGYKKFKEWISSAHPVLTGCGSSYYLCLSAAALYTKLTRRQAQGVSASEICTFPNAIFSDRENYSLLAVSRNGKSAETVGAARWFVDSQFAKPIALSTVTSSPLLEVAELGMLLTVAAERSRYMTRSFTAGLLALQFLVASSTQHHELLNELRKLPEICRRVIDSCRSLVKSIAEEKNFDDYVALGQGPFYGLAAESMLKVKEMVKAPAEAYPSLEVMHGPNYLLSNKTLATLLHADSARSYETALLERMKATGASRFVICEKASSEIRENADFLFELNSGLSESARLILVMPVMQLFAFYRARATGNPLE